MEIVVARQPIYTAKNELFAYELLYRSSGLAIDSGGGGSRDRMSGTVIARSLLDLGMERVTGGAVAFVNFSRDLLLGGYWELFDRERIVIELLESVEPDPPVLEACRALVDAGYTLALDDYVHAPEMEPLLKLAHLVKVDVLERSVDEIAASIEAPLVHGLPLLAERVEDAAMHETCQGLGFSYFQGYHYARPQIVAGREMAPEQISILRLMGLARRLETSESELERAFRSDVALTFKLLKIVNTVAVGGRSVSSIRDALILVGRTALMRWLGLLLFSEMGRCGAANRELSETALSRAWMCERLAPGPYPPSAAGGLFITGLFSLIDRQMGKPMKEILTEIDLAPEVVRALVTREGPYSVPLRMLESHERGDWDAAVAEAADLGLTPDVLTNHYVDSLEWAREQLSLAHAGVRAVSGASFPARPSTSVTTRR